MVILRGYKKQRTMPRIWDLTKEQVFCRVSMEAECCKLQTQLSCLKDKDIVEIHRQTLIEIILNENDTNRRRNFPSSGEPPKHIFSKWSTLHAHCHSFIRSFPITPSFNKDTCLFLLSLYIYCFLLLFEHSQNFFFLYSFYISSLIFYSTWPQ